MGLVDSMKAATARWLGRGAKKTPLGPVYSPEEEAALLESFGRLGARPTDLASLVKTRFEAARLSRQESERDMILGHRFADGQQWSGWNSTTREIYSILEDEDEEDLVVTDNLIGLLTGKVAAILNSSDPDVQPVPSTDSPLNFAASQEARSILAELNRKFSRREQMILLTRWALEAGFCALKVSWNPTKEMEVAKLGPDGSMVGRESVPLGWIEEEIIPGWELYLPPSCKVAKEALWCVHATVKDHAFVRGLGPKFNELQPDTIGQGALSPVWLNFSAINQGLSISPKGADSFSVLDFWHKPVPGVLPDGARIVVVAGEVVHAGPWPYAKRDALPFVFLTWKEALGQPYGKSLAAGLASLQVCYNRALSDGVNANGNAVPTMMVPNGSELEPGSYNVRKNRRYREIYFNGADVGARPGWQDGPAFPSSAEALRQWVWEDMQHIAGIHDPTLGVANGDVSGVALSILRAGDQSQHAPFLAALEGVHRMVREWEIALVAQYALSYVPYVVGVDDSGSPASAPKRQAAMALSAITNGGSVSVHLAPSTGVAETPEGKRQKAKQYHDGGMLGLPGSPMARLRYAKLVPDADSFLLEQWAQEDLEAQAQAAEAQAAAAEQAAAAPGGLPGPEGGLPAGPAPLTEGGVPMDPAGLAGLDLEGLGGENLGSGGSL